MAEGVRNLIIIGSGCAGWTAAIYASRAALKPLVIAGAESGGQLMLTSAVENYPGFASILGPDLMRLFEEQARKFGTEVIKADVKAVAFKSRPFKVFVGEKVFLAKAVIIATGAAAKWLGLANEQRLRGRGVSACAICDALFFKDKEVVVVGGGDTAMEDTITLAKFAKKITIVHRRDEFRASKIMQERALALPKVSVLKSHVVLDVLGADVVEGVRLKNVKDGREFNFPCQGLFVAIGHIPNTKIFEGQIELDQKGYIVVGQGMQTNVPGVFAAGDVHDWRYKQAVTAAGFGCMAALEAEWFLRETSEATES